jgi:hypothetical protein
VDTESLRGRGDLADLLLAPGLRRQGGGTAREDLPATGGNDEGEAGKENAGDHRSEHMFAP